MTVFLVYDTQFVLRFQRKVLLPSCSENLKKLRLNAEMF